MSRTGETCFHLKIDGREDTDDIAPFVRNPNPPAVLVSPHRTIPEARLLRSQNLGRNPCKFSLRYTCVRCPNTSGKYPDDRRPGYRFGNRLLLDPLDPPFSA